MGLKMSDDPNLSTIHVPSGPTTFSQERPSYDGLTITQLMTRKDNLEAELKALGAVLDSHGVTMQSTLTTFDGYPRADIDVAQVRVTRARIIHLRNDWKELMDKIEKGLHEHHASLKSDELSRPAPIETTAPSAIKPAVRSTGNPPPAAPEAPFARVNTVEAGSPAHEAGLKAGDLVRRFGSAIWSNHERLRKVSEVVQENQGRPILVRVQRRVGSDAQELELRLTPRQGWGGRGSLGCHVVPI